MKCKNCQHFTKSSKVEFSEELVDFTGTCNLSGALKKSKDNCTSGNFTRK